MARRRRSAAQTAALNRAIFRSEQGEFAKQLRREIASGIQSAAIEIMNGLVEVGPAWTGKFSASWRFIPKNGDPGGPGPDGQIYRYTKNDLPIYTVERYMRGGGTGKGTQITSVKEFQIVNTAPYANSAIDAEMDYFIRPDEGYPLKDPELGDERNNPSLRWDIGGSFSGRFEEAPASRTAEPDWYGTYIYGGGLQRDLGRGFSVSNFSSRGASSRGDSISLPPSF